MNWSSVPKLVPLAVAALASGFGISPAQRAYEVTPLPFARNLHGAAVVEDHLYAISGDTPTGFTASVQSARINPDRTLGIWTENRPLPVKLIYLGNSVVSVGRTIYVVGGQEVQDGTSAGDYLRDSNNSVYYSRAGFDGALGPWQRSERWENSNCVGLAAVSDGTHLYLIGGQNGFGVVTNAVYFAPITGPDGRPGRWQATNALPTPLWFASAFHHNGVVYTVGGRTGDDETTTTSAIYQARIQPGGQLAPWTEAPQRLAFPVNGASATASPQYLFLFCGRTNSGQLVESIQYSTLSATGIGPWESTETQLSARYYSAAATHEGAAAVYIVGGRRTTNHLDINREVFCFPLARAAGAPEPAPSGFLPWNDAYTIAAKNNRRVLLVFYSDSIPASRAAADSLARSASFFEAIATQATAVLINAAEQPALVQKYSVARVPTFVMTDTTGAALGSISGTFTQLQIEDFVKGTR